MKQLFTLAALCTVFFCFSQTSRIDSLTVTLAYQKQDSAKVDTSILLVKALYYAESYKTALLYIDQTEVLAKQLNYKKGVADVHYYKALIYATKNDYYNALDGFNKAKNYYIELGDTLGVAKVNNSIGLIEIKRGNYNKGLEHSLSAIAVFENNNLRQELSTAYNSLAEAYFNTNQFDKSLEYNLKALNVREGLRDDTAILSSYKNIAKLYSQRREHRKAIEYYEKLMQLMSSSKADTLKGDVLPRIGYEYLQYKNYEKAADYLVEALKYNRRANNDEGLLRALNAIGELNLVQGNVQLARTQVNEAYNIAIKIDDKNQLLTNYRLQKEIDSTKGSYQNAFFWQGKYFDLKTELEHESIAKLPENTEQIKTEPQVVINTNPPVTPNDVIVKRNQDKTNEANLVSYVLAALLFIAVAAIVFLLFKNDKKKTPLTSEVTDQNTIIERDQLRLKNKAYAERIENLEEVNKVKDRLFSIVSHDLKDSISSIKAFIDLIKEGNISPEEFQNLIPELSENADNAMELLFNLLNWSKTQMQNIEPKPEIFNIQEVFHNKMSLVEQKMEQKGIRLVDESHRDFIYADKNMIEIVIQNLITNAVKFTKRGDVITVSNNDHNGKSLICVEDTGVGISKENINKLFQKENFTTNGTNNEKGTGLGLTICKELVELNKGRIWVESKVGIGTKFYVELPKMDPK